MPRVIAYAILWTKFKLKFWNKLADSLHQILQSSVTEILLLKFNMRGQDGAFVFCVLHQSLSHHENMPI